MHTGEVIEADQILARIIVKMSIIIVNKSSRNADTARFWLAYMTLPVEHDNLSDISIHTEHDKGRVKQKLPKLILPFASNCSLKFSSV